MKPPIGYRYGRVNEICPEDSRRISNIHQDYFGEVVSAGYKIDINDYLKVIVPVITKHRRKLDYGIKRAKRKGKK